MFAIKSKSAFETAAIAKFLGEHLPAESLLIMTGEPGAGKTAFAQGLARGLGIKERVSSPTYMLAQEYEGGRLSFNHLDAYRLEGAAVDELGLEEYWLGGGICLIEWGMILADILPEEYTLIDIEVIDENNRLLRFSGQYEEMIGIMLEKEGFEINEADCY